MEPLAPIDTAGLFAPLHGELLALLRALGPADWTRPTVAGSWTVRDVAAHLLDGDLRKLASHRDGHLPEPRAPVESHEDLVRFLNELNAEWVRAARRLSPRLLIELLERTGPQVAALVASLPPHGPSLFPVAWAGEDRSENWLDTGRDFTERWHHQMQIREAVGAPGLLEARWLGPVLEISVRALPRAYQGVEAPAGTAVVVEVGGEGGGAWSLVREAEGWRLWRGAAPDPAARVRLDADAAWRLLFNALPPPVARRRLRVAGQEPLVEPLLGARAVMV